MTWSSFSRVSSRNAANHYSPHRLMSSMQTAPSSGSSSGNVSKLHNSQGANLNLKGWFCSIFFSTSSPNIGLSLVCLIWMLELQICMKDLKYYRGYFIMCHHFIMKIFKPNLGLPFEICPSTHRVQYRGPQKSKLAMASASFFLKLV